MQFSDRIVDVPVVTQRQIPAQRVQTKIESPRTQRLDKTVNVPVVQVHRSASWKRRSRSHSRRSCSNTLRSLKLRTGRPCSSPRVANPAVEGTSAATDSRANRESACRDTDRSPRSRTWRNSRDPRGLVHRQDHGSASRVPTPRTRSQSEFVRSSLETSVEESPVAVQLTPYAC